MPEIAFSHIVSCSSEDKVYCANNLLKADTFRKWKTAESGEKHATVIIQFNKAEKIDALHIGNEGSAFIEVLVGKSAWTHNEDFKVLLVTSSFMSPQESKSGTSLNRVRMFDTNELSKSALDDSWDRVKIVCTQPYNKNIAYGISFIKLISPGGSDVAGVDKGSPSTSRLGGFHLKKDEEQTFVPGALFRTFSKDVSHKDKSAQNVDPPTARSKVIEVKMDNEVIDNSQSTPVTTLSHNLSVAKPSISVATKRKSDDNIKPNIKQATAIESNESGSRLKKPKVQDDNSANKSSTNQKVAGNIKEKTENKKMSLATEEETPTDDEASDEETLAGVIAVLSGYQNPLRGQLRTQLTNLGGCYRPDWGKDCTHLICAFKGTPKYNQVRKTKCKIVSSNWLSDCYKHKRRLPTKKYSLRSDDEDSSDENYLTVRSKKSLAKVSRSSNDSSMSTSSEIRRETEKNKIPVARRLSQEATRTSNMNKDVNKSTKLRAMDVDPDSSTTAVDDVPATLPLEVLDDTPATLPLAAMDDTAATLPLDCANDTDSTLPLDDACDSNATLPLDADSASELSPKTKDPEKNKVDNYDPYECSTEEEEQLEAYPSRNKSLPDYFCGQRFLLYGDYSYDERRTLIRYLTAYDGVVEEYMNERVNIVITDNLWDDKFDQALVDFPNLTFVKSKWIYECHNHQKRLPYQKYLVTC